MYTCLQYLNQNQLECKIRTIVGMSGLRHACDRVRKRPGPLSRNNSCHLASAANDRPPHFSHMTNGGFVRRLCENSDFFCVLCRSVFEISKLVAQLEQRGPNFGNFWHLLISSIVSTQPPDEADILFSAYRALYGPQRSFAALRHSH